MGALSRPYERRAKPLSPTFVPYRAAVVIPLALASALVILAAELFPIARDRIMAASLPSRSTSAKAEMSHQPSLKGQNPLSLFSPEVRSWEREILRWSSEHKLPPELVATVMQIESCGAANVTSSAGAMGLFQVMPFHFSQSDDPYDPDVNAARGLKYLSRSFALAGGAIDKTLAGYNGGHSVINWDPTMWSAETSRYVRWGTGIWEDIHLSGLQSKTLEEWLNAGGEYLCRQARDDISPR